MTRRPLWRCLLAGAALIAIVLLLARQDSPRTPTTDGSPRPAEGPQSTGNPPARGLPASAGVAPAAVPRPPTELSALLAAPDSALGKFQSWTQRYLAASDTERVSLEGEGVELARARRAELRRLIVGNPREALRQAVPMVVRQELPASVLEQLEERVNGRAQLRVLLSKPEPGTATTQPPILRYAEFEDGLTYEAHVFGRRAESVRWVPNASLNGIALDRHLAVSESPLRALELGEVPPAGKPAVEACPVSGNTTAAVATGAAITESTPAVEVYGRIVYLCDGSHVTFYEEQLIYGEGATGGPQRFTGILPGAPAPSIGQMRVLYIPMTFADQNEVPASEARCYEVMRDVADFYYRSSYGRLTVMSTVTPPVKLPHNEAWYVQKDTSDGFSKEIDGLGLEHQHAREEARKLGFDSNDYDAVVVRLEGGPRVTGGWGGGPSVWTYSDSVGVITHELGHVFGLAHANFWDTGGASDIGPGGNQEYGDIFDVMGGGGTPNGHFNVQAKNVSKWLPDDYIQTITASGTYRIHAQDQVLLDPRKRYALRVTKDNQRTYWGEVRTLFDSANKWAANGLILGWKWPGNSGNNIQLIDTTPRSPGAKNDCPIVLGQTFSDFEAGIHLTTIGVTNIAGERSLDVVVNLGAFPSNQPPTLGLVASAVNVPTSTPVTFTATANDPDGDPLAYQWLSSDNTSASTATIGPNAAQFTRSFTTAGQYVVTCVASDMKGGTATRRVLVTVGNGNSRYSISGRITLGGVGLQGVYVSTGGTDAVLSDTDGYFTIPNLVAGSYTIAPQLYGFTFGELFENSVLVGPSFAGADFAADLLPSVTIAATVPTAQEAASPTAGRFTLARTGPDADPLIVMVVPAFGSASGGDYAFSPVAGAGSPYNTFTIPAGSNSLNITVTPVNDGTSEGPETVILQLGIDVNYVIAGGATATVVINDDDTTLPTISITGSAIAAVESPSTPNTFTVSRTGATTSNLTVNLAITGTAGNGSDYSALATNITLLTGFSNALITVTPLDDAASEGFESVIVSVNTGSGYFRSPTVNTATNLIVDDDLQVVSLEVTDPTGAEVDLTAPGAVPNPAAMIVSRTGDTTQALTVYYALSGTALHGVDYEPLPGSVVIPAGQTRVPLVLTPRWDGLGEAAEIVTIQLGAGDSRYRLGAVSGGSVTINDAGDPPYVEVIPWLSASEPATAGSFRFTLKGSVASNIVVNYTVGGTAVAGVDYTALSGTVTINGTGTNNATNVSVVPITNAIANPLRSISVSITANSNYQTWLPTATASIWLYDDEQPTVFVDAHTTTSSGIATATESGTGTTNKFYLSRTGSTAGALTVNYTISGTASNGTDYTALSGTANIPAGAPGVDVVFFTLQDALAEGTETVTLSLAAGSYSAGPSATFYITDDETPTPRVAFTANSSVALESAGTVNIPVVLSTNSASTVGVEYAVLTGGTGTSSVTTSNSLNLPYWLRLTRTNNAFRSYYSSNGTTWVAIGGAVTNAFADPAKVGLAVSSRSDGNLTTAAFDNVALSPDPGGGFIDGNVGFVSASGSYTTNGGTNLVAGSGADIVGSADEFYFASKPVSGDFTFSARVVSSTGGGATRLAGLMAREDLRRNARHVFVAEQGTNQVVTFNRTNSSVTAQGLGVDFTLAEGLLTFAPGVVSNNIAVAIHDDLVAEANEQLVLTLRNASNAALGLVQHVLAIQDNDVSPLQPSVGFAAATSSGPESAAPAVLVVLSAPATAPVSVDYSAIGGTAAPGDYALTAGTLIFAAGESVKVLPLTFTEDVEVEPAETLVIALSNVVGATLTTLSNHTATILDNDLSVITVAASDASATEGGDTGQWLFTRTGADTSTNLTVYFTRTGTAATNDFTAIGTNVTFDAGSNTVALTLTALTDTAVEGNETVILTLSNQTAYVVGTPSNATVSIVDVNIPTVGVVASTPFGSETGPSNGVFTVTRVGPTNAALTINFTVSGTATSGSDFTSIGTSKVIPAGQSNATINVTPINDSLTEGNEAVLVTISSSANYLIGSNNFTSVTVLDNDSPPTVTVSSPNAKSVQLASGNGLNLVASATDDGAPNPLTFVWSQFSGPGTVTFGSPNTSNTTATFSTNGLYICRVTVSDGQFTTFDDVTVQVGGFAPLDWMDISLGAPSTRGTSGQTNGVFTVTGSGAGFNATTDGGHFVARQVAGTNSSVIARLTSFAGTTTNAMAGVMIRETGFRGARRALLSVRTNGTVEFHTRTSLSGANSVTNGGTNMLPVWLRLDRTNDTITAFKAPDVAGAPGVWAQVGSTLTLTGLRADVDEGVAASNGSNNTRADAKFDNVGLTPAPAGPALVAEDLGSTTFVGSATLTNGTNTIIGSGSLGDGGFYKFQQYVGDLTVTARILSHTASGFSAKGGVMVRDVSLDAAPHGSMGIAHYWGGYFVWRNVSGGSAGTIYGGTAANPQWIRVIRKGNAVTAWKASNTASNMPGTWVQQGAAQVFATGAPIYVGLAADGSPSNVVKLDNYSIAVGNTAPVVDAGLGGALTGTSTNLAGAVNDDGDPNPPGAVTFAWSQVSGPASATISNATSLTSGVSFPVSGAYVLRLTATDGEASVFDDVTWNVVLGGPFEAWQTANFGSTTNVLAAPGADPDGDGVFNLAEYGYATDPNAPNVAPFTFSLTNIGGALYFRVNVPKNSNATDISFGLQWAGPLSNPSVWSGAGLITQQNTITNLAVRDGVSLNLLTNRSYRVNVTKP